VRREFHESARKDYEVRDNSCNSCRAPARFWRNVTLIALAHLALIAGLIRWSVAARVPSNPESILWLGGAENLALRESANQESPSKHATTSTEPRPLKNDEAEEEKHGVTTAKSEIEFPSPTPKTTPTSTPAPKPTATPAPKPKPTPKPIPKKTLVAKASPKPKTTLTSEKFSEKSAKNERKILPKNEYQSQSARGKTTSAGKAGSAAGGNSASEFSWYGNMLHDRFYSAWIQPTTNVASGTKISTLVKLRIEKDGRVSKFEIIKPSENVVVNESVEAIAKRVSEVDPPPAGLINGDHYDVKINFELNTDQRTESR
jgi:outer membrane biosynthesis protein TonB